MIKGITPLVASVILIAITMAIAGVLSYWASGIGNHGTESEDPCMNADFRLYSGNYDDSTGILFLVLENTKEYNLNDLTLYLSYPDQRIAEKSLGALEGNSLKSFSITEVDDNFESAIIKTNCPEVSVEFTYSQVT